MKKELEVQREQTMRLKEGSDYGGAKVERRKEEEKKRLRGA